MPIAQIATIRIVFMSVPPIHSCGNGQRVTGRKAIPDGSRENAASRCYRYVNTAVGPPSAPST
jgi:hypothetical protein